MAVRYGSPFKLFTVLLEPEDPRAGKRRQIRDRKAALKLAKEVAKQAKLRIEEVFWESTVYYAKEYLRGRGSRRVSTGQSLRELAVAWCKKREREGLGAVNRARKPLAEATKEWLEEVEARGRRAKTLKDYRIQIRFWLDFFPGKAVGELTHKDLVRFFKERKGGPKLKNGNLTLWRSFFRWSVQQGFAEQDITQGIKPWKLPHRDPRVLSAEDLQKLLRCCREKYSVDASGIRNLGSRKAGPMSEEETNWSQDFLPPPKLYAAVLCGITTLLRKSSVLGLRWEDIDFERDEIHVKPEATKTAVELRLPLARSLKVALSEMPKGKPADLVFSGLTLHHNFRNATKRAGLGSHGFHIIRRSSATLLCQHGIPIEVTMRLGGWSTGRSVLLTHYRAIDAKELRKAVDLLDKLVTGQAAKSEDKASAAQGG